jgi:large subunit ribosomal protein L19
MHLREIVNKRQLEQKGQDRPILCLGDTIRVSVLIEEANKRRIQFYQGTLIAKHQSGISTTIIVRRVFRGVGMERVFFLHSPLIQDIKVLRRAKVRRAKLYYLRYLKGKAIRLKDRFVKF